MLGILGELARNLILIVFINTLLEMLLPRGEFYRYIRLVTGMIIILLTVNAIGQLLWRAPRESPATPVSYRSPAVVGDGGRLWEINRRQALDLYRSSLEQAVREEAEGAGFRLWQVRFFVEEDPARENFGEVYRLEVLVEAAAGSLYQGVEPVVIGPGSADKEAASPDSAAAAEGGAEAAGGLAEALARRLQLSSDKIEVNLKR